jgi:hypothetical protein
MTVRTVVLGALAALGFAVAAEAGTVTFDFAAENSGSWASSIAYSEGGIGLTVSAKTTDGQSAKVRTWAGAGLGVCNVNEQRAWCPGGEHQIDSYGLNEVVVLTFSRIVTMTQIAFNYVDTNDTFDLVVGGATALDNAALPDSWMAVVDPAGPHTEMIFGIGAGSTTVRQCSTWRGQTKCWDETLDSAFKLKSVTVAAVPLPATALLLAGALGLLALGSRRRAA